MASRKSSVSDVSEETHPLEDIPTSKLANSQTFTAPPAKKEEWTDKIPGSFVGIVEEEDKASPVRVESQTIEDVIAQEGLLDYQEKFNINDPIFSLKGPVKELKEGDNTSCGECGMSITKKNKKFCQFCGRVRCSTCLIKKRAIPAKPGHRFDICNGCSHKFFIQELYKEYGEGIALREKQTSELQKEFLQRKDEYMKFRSAYNDRKRVLKASRRDQKKYLSELELKISQLTRDKINIMRDNEELNDSLATIQKAMKDIDAKTNETETKKADKKKEVQMTNAEKEALNRDKETILRDLQEVNNKLMMLRMKQPKQKKIKKKDANLGLKDSILEPVNDKEAAPLRESLIDTPVNVEQESSGDTKVKVQAAKKCC